MTFYLSFIVIFCLVVSSETTIGPGSRKTTTRAPEKATVTSTPPPSVPSVESLLPTKTNVLQRNLVEDNTNAKSILENHKSYCSACLETQEFTNPTLVYVTPWNSHGYEIAKIFTKKFNYISPVWLNIKRTGFEKYSMAGAHDIDKKWIQVLKENNPKVQIVPRVIFENWSADDIHALFQSENEKQQLASTFASFLNDNTDLFDGYVLEILVQFRGASKPTLSHIITDIAEHIHRIENNNKKKEIILAVPPYEELFNKNDFEMLYEHLDGFSVMTYDFPNREPGPVAPLEWIKLTMERFSVPEGEPSIKVFLGLNFYGYRYDQAESPKNADQQQYGMKPIVGQDYIDFLRKSYPKAFIVYDPRSDEHATVIHGRPTKQQQQPLPQTIIFYPSLKSIYKRLELATKLHVGVAIWDGGQGQFIETFWRKSFIGDLRRARKLTDDDTQWTIVYNGKDHQFQFVWLQGLCIKIDKLADLIIIEDATGQAEVQNCSRVPDVWLTNEGDYVMVAGRLLNVTTSSNRIIVDGYRIQYFRTSSKHELNWPFEVIDISQRVYQ